MNSLDANRGFLEKRIQSIWPQCLVPLCEEAINGHKIIWNKQKYIFKLNQGSANHSGSISPVTP